MSELNRWDYATYSGHVEWYEDQQQGEFVFYDEAKAELDELQKRPTCEEVEALRIELEAEKSRLEYPTEEIADLQAQVEELKEYLGHLVVEQHQMSFLEWKRAKDEGGNDE